MAQVNDSVLIIGAGVFGISTAYHLLTRGFTDVTILERAETLPPADGTSNDFNRSKKLFQSFPIFSLTCSQLCERPIMTLSMQSWLMMPFSRGRTENYSETVIKSNQFYHALY